jgi:hypothetical protein
MAAAKKATKKEVAIKKVGKELPKVRSTDSGLAMVSRLATLQHQLFLNVAEAEDDLAKAKAAFKKVAEEDLPMAMEEVGIKKFETEDGLVVEYKPEVTASISVANRPAAYHWLIANDFGGLLKINVEVHFERGDREKADKLAEMIRKKGVEVDVEQTIHAQTLKAFVKERMADTESDLEFPLELFGAHAYNVATVKPKNKPKNKPKK